MLNTFLTKLISRIKHLLPFSALLLFCNSLVMPLCEIPSSEIDPLAYVNYVDGVFSFQRINVQKVIKLLKAIDVSKATGLDKIPNRLLKIAADVVAPSLTGIFNQSLVTGIFPSDWKMAKVSPIFKNGSKSDLNNYRPI